LKTLYKTEPIPAVAKALGQGQPAAGVAWFELVLHEGPADCETWGGGGRTVAFWRAQFEERRSPSPWTIEAARMEGVPAAVIPPEVVQVLPDDARLEFVWHFVPQDLAARTQPAS
jgi:hypothetical protein